jgi:BioD-like phosphotransacetylase family protein
VPIVVVTANQPREGKTGVAAAIARHYAYQGREVRLVRIAGSESPHTADSDAALFASFAFAPGSSAATAAPASVIEPGGDAILVVEAAAADAAAIPGAKVVLVSRVAAPKPPAGVTPVATVQTDVPLSAVHANGATPAVIQLPEDRTLAGFSVAEARAALRADEIVPGDGDEPTCDHLVIAPIASDAGQPYFRRFGTKAVVVRFDKTDMHLAAMQADPSCLILTGGRMPSDYLFDAASAKGIPVLLSRTDTENTVIALEGVFDNTRFQGERKLDRMAELLEPTALYEALAL